MLEATRPDVLLACPIHTAHAAAVRAGLDAGATCSSRSRSRPSSPTRWQLTALAEERGLLVGVVQNWRTKSAGKALRQAIEAGRIGEVSHIAFRYLRDREKPHLPDYLFEEDDPLLYAMAIHHFDLFRYALGQEIVRVVGPRGAAALEPLPRQLDQRPLDGDRRRRRDLLRRELLLAQRAHPAGERSRSRASSARSTTTAPTSSRR